MCRKKKKQAGSGGRPIIGENLKWICRIKQIKRSTDEKIYTEHTYTTAVEKRHWHDYMSS